MNKWEKLIILAYFIIWIMIVIVLFLFLYNLFNDHCPEKEKICRRYSKRMFPEGLNIILKDCDIEYICLKEDLYEKND